MDERERLKLELAVTLCIFCEVMRIAELTHATAFTINALREWRIEVLQSLQNKIDRLPK